MAPGEQSHCIVVPAFRDSPRSRWPIVFSAAFALHFAGALIGYRSGRGVARDTAPQADRVANDDIPIELIEPYVDMPDPSAAKATAEVGDPLASSAIAMSATTRMRSDRNSAALGAGASPQREPSIGDSKAEGEYALDPTAGVAPGAPTGAPIQLGIGAGEWSRWVDPTGAPSGGGAEQGAHRPAPVSSTGGLAEALEAHDQALGLGPAGAVLTAVHEAGYSEIAPALGTATFSITVLRSGAIEVQLTGASSQAAAWAKVGESIAAAIRRKPPRIAPTRIGVRLGIEVVAEERWPNGQATRSDHGPKIAAAPPKFQATDTAKQQLLDRNPAAVPEPDAPGGKPPGLQVNFDAPGVFVEGRGKVCSYRVGLSPIPISGACDPTNIGQPARRVVSTRVISQTML